MKFAWLRATKSIVIWSTVNIDAAKGFHENLEQKSSYRPTKIKYSLFTMNITRKACTVRARVGGASRGGGKCHVPPLWARPPRWNQLISLLMKLIKPQVIHGLIADFKICAVMVILIDSGNYLSIMSASLQSKSWSFSMSKLLRSNNQHNKLAAMFGRWVCGRILDTYLRVLLARAACMLIAIYRVQPSCHGSALSPYNKEIVPVLNNALFMVYP